MDGHDLLEQRIESVGEHLASLARAWAEGAHPVPAPLREAKTWLITGAGGSAGPAHMLVDALLERGRVARYEPLSHFLEPDAEAADVLVVFSQGLSPNARLALARHERFAHTVLFTSVDPEASDVEAVIAQASHVISLPPKREDQLLVRVVGPCVATLAALLFADAIDNRSAPLDVASLAEARGASSPMEVEPDGGAIASLALVPFGEGARRYHGIANKLLEAIGEPVPIWDVLGVTHGPLQYFHGQPITLLGLMRDTREHHDLADRLDAILDPKRGQQLLRCVAPHARPLDWFAHDAMIDRVLIGAMRGRERDLIDWPGKGADQSLYGLGR